jgi:hypothetical protein
VLAVVLSAAKDLNDNCIEYDNDYQRIEEPLPMMQKNRLGASS